MMIYLSRSDYINFIFDRIRELAYDDVQKPAYENDRRGLEHLSGVLEQIRNHHYYPNFYKKATYLFVALSTGHYFENGNKRLSLYSYVIFSHINGYRFKSINKRNYNSWFRSHFPNYKLEKVKFNTNIGWALYNYNKVINMKATSHGQGHSYNFDQLKQVTEKFFRFITIKK